MLLFNCEIHFNSKSNLIISLIHELNLIDLLV